MKSNNELMQAIKKELVTLSAKSQAGDKDAHIEWAIGNAIYEVMQQGYLLTDLEWFKYTPYYTGDRLKKSHAA